MSLPRFLQKTLFTVVILTVGCSYYCCMVRAAEHTDRRDTAQISRRLPGHEKLVYELKWLKFPVGIATASINGIKDINGRPAYELEVTTKTNDFCSSIYKVDDRYVSYLDVEGLYTVRHEVYRREGLYKKDAVTDFDQINHKAYFKNTLDHSRKVIDIPFGTQDLVSMLYYFRLVPIKDGRREEFSVYNNESVYRIYGDIGRKESVSIPYLGVWEAFKVQPYAILNGKEVKKGKAKIYFSCDDKQIPIKAVAEGPVFTSVAGYFLYSE